MLYIRINFSYHSILWRAVSCLGKEVEMICMEKNADRELFQANKRIVNHTEKDMGKDWSDEHFGMIDIISRSFYRIEKYKVIF